MKELGRLMRGARRLKRVTLQEAADATRIRAEYLSAIEDGDFRALPGTVYVAGFLKNYASYLDLNADEVVDTYHTDTPRCVDDVQPASRLGLQRLRRRFRRRLTWAMGTLAVLTALGFAVHAKVDSGQAGAAGLGPNIRLATSGFGPSHPHGARVATIRVQALYNTWACVRVDSKLAFWGVLLGNTTHHWRGRALTISTKHGDHLKIWDGSKSLGLVSRTPGRIVLRVVAGSTPRVG